MKELIKQFEVSNNVYLGIGLIDIRILKVFPFPIYTNILKHLHKAVKISKGSFKEKCDHATMFPPVL